MKKLALVLVTFVGIMGSSLVASAQDAGAVTGSDASFGGLRSGTKALSFGLPAGGGVSAAVEYFLAPDAALDLDFQAPGAFDFGKVTTTVAGMSTSTTDLTFDFTIGYKMYKAHEGRVTTFIEPALELGGDTSNFSTTFHAGIGAVLGAEFWVAPQFALGGGVGLALDFTNKFKDFDLHTFNTGLFASFFWN